jgi:hypothetical protein
LRPESISLFEGLRERGRLELERNLLLNSRIWARGKGDTFAEEGLFNFKGAREEGIIRKSLSRIKARSY